MMKTNAVCWSSGPRRRAAPGGLAMVTRWMAAALALVAALMTAVAAAAHRQDQAAMAASPGLVLRVQPEAPTLIDEVVLEARIVIEFGRQVEFDLDDIDPATWLVATPATPRQATRWRESGVEHVARWSLTPFLPGEARLPQVRARVSAAAAAQAGDESSEGFAVVAGGGLVTIAPPPAAIGEIRPGPGDVVTDWPAADRWWSWPALAAVAAAALAAVATAVWWLMRKRRLRTAAVEESPEALVARLRQQLEHLRLSEELPTRPQVARWRRLLVRARRGVVPDGLLAQADGLLYQSGTFDGATARLWAADLARWLDQAQPGGPERAIEPIHPA